jgi:hypothetical protein
MGSQQLLLIVLSMVLIGVALTVAITMFQANAIESNRAALTDDLLYFATRARDYYWRPSTLGGGNRSFLGITNLRMLSNMTSNENGEYKIESISKDELIIIGTGKVEVGTDFTEVRVIINESKNTFQIVH